MKSQFYLMENPKTGDTNDQFIFHAKKPMFIAKVIQFEDDLEMITTDIEGENVSFFYINPDGLREIYVIAIIENFGGDDEKIFSKLKRMADWWISYLVWEDSNRGIGGGKSFEIEDYNKKCKGLKILYSSTSQKWCVIYRGIVKTFNNEVEMDNFLLEKLMFSEEDINDGVINNI